MKPVPLEKVTLSCVLNLAFPGKIVIPMGLQIYKQGGEYVHNPKAQNWVIPSFMGHPVVAVTQERRWRQQNKRPSTGYCFTSDTCK